MTVTILLIAVLLVSGAANVVLIWAVFPMLPGLGDGECQKTN
jgi:hypothetical protein